MTGIEGQCVDDDDDDDDGVDGVDDDDNDDEDDDDDDACTLLSMYEVLLLHRTRLKRHLLRRM